MPTAQAMITNSLVRLGILEQGGTPSTSDTTDALANLNSMWEGWSIDEGLIFGEQTQQFLLTAGVGFYAIGPTASAPFNVPLPTRIYKAYFVTSGGRNEIEIVTAEKYFSHNDTAAVAVAPDEFYCDWIPDPTTGSYTIRLWPIQSVSGASLELESGALFKAFTLGPNFTLPHGYQDAIEWALAYRLLSSFGAAVVPEVAQNVAAIGSKAEARIRAMNAKDRMKQPLEVMPPGMQLQAALPPKQG